MKESKYRVLIKQSKSSSIATSISILKKWLIDFLSGRTSTNGAKIFIPILKAQRRVKVGECVDAIGISYDSVLSI